MKRCAQLRNLIELNKNNENVLVDLSECDLEKIKISDKNENDTKNDKINLTLDEISIDFNSIDLNWKSTRKNCVCYEPFDFASSKLNCSRCGEILCERCVEDGKYVSSTVSTKLFFVCKNCVDQFRL